MPSECDLQSIGFGTERRNVVDSGHHTRRKSIPHAFMHSPFVRVLEQIHILDSYYAHQSRGKTAASPGTHAVGLNLGVCTRTSMVVRKERRRTQ